MVEPEGACWYTRKRLFDGVVPAKAVRDACLVGAVAQLGERLVRNEEVSGSIPLSSTKTIFNNILASPKVSIKAGFSIVFRPGSAHDIH
jgi:hypothetical protein